VAGGAWFRINMVYRASAVGPEFRLPGQACRILWAN